MTLQPDLKTERLVLRAFTLEDASRVKALAGDKQIADVTANIPHPYPEELAKEWISSHSQLWKISQSVSYAITISESQLLIGAISLMNNNNDEAELGYWIGVDYWSKGYCTEACREIIDFGFNELKLKRIHAHFLTRNPASGAVLIKSGFSSIGSGESICGYRNKKESTEQYEIKNKEQ